MDDEDFGTDRDPLLVRPFVVQDGEPTESGSSGATWPAGTASDSPTQILPVFSGTAARKPRGPRRRRRPLLVAGVGAGVVTVLAVAGYTALRPVFEPTLSADLPDRPLPAVTGPAAASASPSPGDDAAGATTGSAGSTGTGGDSGHTRDPKPTASVAASSGPATTATTPATRTTASAEAGSTAGSGTTAPLPAAIAPSPLTAGTGALVSGNGLCLDVPNAIPSDDNSMQVFDCNGSIAQVWTLADDGTLRVMGRCALLVGDDTVHLADCDRRTPSLWRTTGAHEVINMASNECLTDPSGGARPGTRVVVVRCTGESHQRWSLR
ncbi:RICIN domain-containing protein [Actinoplanes oblitus]|uniref:RICIN domain-containing protein n=1 Tax=Actinoplanes oblitus TaxID=3040509 RepID=A0ABY8WMH7_9ACTN|nr:RICIN domain-containing protein [Actinoplanes oblitus]WIM99064.1 RICIN domain-containing protein [Actinoplanes oblitus]